MFNRLHCCIAARTPELRGAPIMRFNTAFTSALVSSATLMGYAYAEEAEKQADSSSVAEKPTFTVSCATATPNFISSTD